MKSWKTKILETNSPSDVTPAKKVKNDVEKAKNELQQLLADANVSADQLKEGMNHASYTGPAVYKDGRPEKNGQGVICPEIWMDRKKFLSPVLVYG